MKKYTWVTVLAASSLVGLACGSRAPAAESSSALSVADETVVVMAFNLRGPGFWDCGPDDRACEDLKIAGLAAVIAEARPSIVALSEVDLFTRRCGQNVAERMAEELQRLTGQVWYSAFHASCRYQGGRYGNAVLSTAPIDEVRGINLEENGASAGELECRTPGAEQHCADNPPAAGSVSAADYQQMSAIIATTHGLVVASTHLTPGHCIPWVRDAELAMLLAALDPEHPTIIAGDMNEGDSLFDRNQLGADWTNTTQTLSVTSTEFAGKIDHIFSRNVAVERNEAGVPVARSLEPGAFSDHFAVFVTLRP